MDYPDDCIKGLSKGSEITVEGFAPENAFHFDIDKFPRKDGWHEQSINWKDDDSVIGFTLNQKKENGDIQFINGAAVISRCEIDRLINRISIKDLLKYERDPIDNNPFHGNILLKSGTSKKTMKIIAAGISLAVEKIVPFTST